jgi:hypothetical protein
MRLTGKLTIPWFMNLDQQSKVTIIAALVGAVFGLIGGLFGPILQAEIETKGNLAKTNLEADLARQSKLIDAQAKFLDDISRYLWEWRYLSIRVAYYGSHNKSDVYESAWKEYDKDIWIKLNQVRSLISTSYRLVTNNKYNDLKKFYEYMVDLDKKISKVSTISNIDDRSKSFNIINSIIYEDVSNRIDRLIFGIGLEFGLNSNTNSKPIDANAPVVVGRTNP